MMKQSLNLITLLKTLACFLVIMIFSQDSFAKVTAEEKVLKLHKKFSNENLKFSIKVNSEKNQKKCSIKT